MLMKLIVAGIPQGDPT
ncbi:hypothetical protein JL09_g6949 [Pichia kudriavzevii]|uniref:Uncharacterized protein n=1 Tax=Pichia kudriavzevii TaxID=4909 RepID=A0A099NK21_PICKU|nr:hypothetical protein JL09_g6952 [Pichia kudriavzevii]KGK32444.1 hypothetical protein JL09_g6949 [Pichia kudriavzevii]